MCNVSVSGFVVGRFWTWFLHNQKHEQRYEVYHLKVKFRANNPEVSGSDLKHYVKQKKTWNILEFSTSSKFSTYWTRKGAIRFPSSVGNRDDDAACFFSYRQCPCPSQRLLALQWICNPLLMLYFSYILPAEQPFQGITVMGFWVKQWFPWIDKLVKKRISFNLMFIL